MNKIINILCVATLTLTLSSCAKMYLSKGKEDYQNLKYMDAIQSLERSVEKKASVEGSTLLARAYSETNQPVAAVYEYEKIKDDRKFTDELKLEYATNLLGAERYEDASKLASEILSKDPGNLIAMSLQRSASRAGIMKQDSSLYQVEKFNVNGVASAMSPVNIKDGLLITGVQNNLKIKDDYTGYSYLDIYMLKDSGSVSKMPFSDSKFHDAMPAFDEEKGVMYFTRSNQTSANELAYNSENTSHPQIYMSKTEGEAWSNPEKLRFNNVNYIFAHPVLSKDGKTMYFSSNQPGGTGGMDLYKSSLSNGEWSIPENLGSSINTSGNEAFPTLKDDNTLYFSSDGHQTLGGMDVLYSSNINGAWSEPTHISYPINSNRDDFGLIYTEKEKGLFSSDRSGADQIYNFEEFFPELDMEGAVADAETGEPIENVQIILKNLTDNTSEPLSLDENGQLKADLLPNKEYEILAEDNSEDQVYFNSSKKISTLGLKEDETFDIDFKLDKIIKTPKDPDNVQPGEDGTFPIPNIYWDYNKWEVRDDAKPYLDMVTDLLKTNPNLKVEIRSHCDSRGSNGFNRGLSKKRAQAVKTYLISQGINESRLSSKGMGESDLLNDCEDGVPCSEERHQKNRRSDFVILDKKGNAKKLN
ncbi:MAG: OmpA family protein [Flavobacteriales bacterium]